MYLQLIHPHLLFVFLTRIIRRRIAGHWLVFCWLSGLGLVLPATAQTTAVAPAGSGTSGDPYIIASLGNLSYLAQNLGATDYWASGLYFVQTADIDASQTQYWDDADDNTDGDLYNDPNDGTATGNNEGWKPIGAFADKFEGNYDGGGYGISNLYIYRSSASHIGFFSSTSGGEITDVHLQSVDITGDYRVGGLLGHMASGTVEGCSVTGSLTGRDSGGGIIGETGGGTLRNSYANCQVEDGPGSGNANGVLVGRNYGTIERCYSQGSVAGYFQVGGLVGHSNGTIRHSFSHATVTGDSRVGGLVGNNSYTSLTFSYAIGSVTGNSDVGGLLGITNSSPYQSFWDTETSGQAASAGGTGKTTAEMKTLATFTGASWDFIDETANGSNDYWGLCKWSNDGYPFLAWQGYDHDCEYTPHGGYTLDFDGTDEYIEVPYAAALNPALFTIEAWAKVEGGSGTFRSVLTSRNGANPSQGYMFYAADDNTWQFWTGDGGDGTWDNVLSGEAITDAWTHIAASFDGTSVRLYINGELKATTAVTYVQNTARHLRIGTGVTEASPLYYFPGKIDEVRIWSDVRSQAEIQANMHKELAGTEANLEAYYTMYDGSGTTLTDNSDHGHTGTLTNDPTWTTSGAHAGPGMAMDFDGVDDYLYAPLNGDATASFTIEGWFSFNSLTNQQNIINLHQTGDPTIRAVPYKTAANEVAFFIYDGASSYVVTSTFVIAQADVWHHLAFIYDAGTMTIYVDGQLAGSATGQGSFSTGATNLFSIGADYNGVGAGFYANIKADEVRFWSDVRTEAEIRAYMYRTLDGDEDGLEAYYRFDQQADASHGTLYDQTANAHHGTLANMDPATDWVASTAFNTWIGSDDDDWSNAHNWSLEATPTTEDVGIFGWSGSSVPAVANISARHFYLDAGVTLDHTGNLTLSGDFYNAGTFSTSGTVTCSGSTAQRIQGTGSTTFGDFVVNNASGVTLYQDLATTDLTLTAGALSLDDQTLSIAGDISKNTGTLSGTSSSGIAIGGSAAALTFLPAVDLGSLSLDRSAGIRLSGTVSVTSTLTLTDGTIDLNNNTLSLGNAATVAGSPDAAAHIDARTGALRKGYAATGNFTFPVGDGTLYTPISLDFTSGTFASAYADVSLLAQKHASNNSTTHYLNRYWTVSSSGISAFSCDVTAIYAAGDVQGTESELHGGKWDGATWLDLGPVDAVGHQIEATVSSFSDFTAGEATAFPVAWLSFSATPGTGQVQLDWITAREMNSAYFAIERSGDEVIWTEIGQQAAAGYASTETHYRWTDHAPLTGLAHYRLRQVDIDGRYDYSPTVMVHADGFSFSIYPNPVRDLLHLHIAGDWTARLTDAQGRELRHLRGNGYLAADLGNLPAGLYFLHLEAAGQQHGLVLRKD